MKPMFVGSIISNPFASALGPFAFAAFEGL
jgi:hypothetical protein